jgi:hypothetical protein
MRLGCDRESESHHPDVDDRHTGSACAAGFACNMEACEETYSPSDVSLIKSPSNSQEALGSRMEYGYHVSE